MEYDQQGAVAVEEDDLWVRIAEAEVVTLREHGYLTADGERDDRKIDDVLLARILRAEAKARREREIVVVTRAAMMREAFPSLPGPGQFAEQPDPTVAQVLWAKLDTFLWRRLSANADGPIQSRLNGEHSLVLCRTKATSERDMQGVYVTRDWQCLLADFTTPDSKAIARAIAKMGRNVAMAAERVPEHGTKLRREMQKNTRDALESASVAISTQIDAAGEEPSAPSAVNETPGGDE